MLALRPFFGRLRGCLCTACFAIFLFFGVLWIRSFRSPDGAHWHRGGGTVACQLISTHGELQLIEFPTWAGDFYTSWDVNNWADLAPKPPTYERDVYRTTFGFAYRRATIPVASKNIVIIIFPHLLLIAASGLTFVLLKKRPRLQFSLFNLFVVISCVAVVLGGFAAVDRIRRKTPPQDVIEAAKRHLPANATGSALLEDRPGH